MALKVWLPLNGNINNYGISDLAFTNISSSNTTNSTAGKIGNCYTNNSNTAGGLLSDKTINLGSQQSMCCWVKFNSFYSSANLTGIGGQHRYYDKAPSNMGLTAKYLSANTGKLSVNTAVGTSRTYNTYCGNTTLNSGIWYHVAYTYDGTTVSLYVNGILDGTFNIPNMVIKADYIYLFSWSSSGASDKAIYRDFQLNGSLNDFRVYDHCLSPKEVKEISKGLCLHYKLDGVCNTVDSTEWDCSGFGNNGTKNGSITLVDSGGRYSKAYSFPNNCNTRVYSTVAPKLLKNLTFSCWCKVQQGSNSTWSFIVSQGRDNTADGFNIILNSSLHYCIHGPFGIVDSGVSANNTWTHVVGTYDGANVKIFINGILKNTKAYTANLVYNYAPAFVVGKMSYNYTSDASYFPTNGAISDVRVYATALSDADVLELYNTSLSIDNVGNMYTYEFKEIE